MLVNIGTSKVNAAVEVEPRELAVDVVLGTGEIDGHAYFSRLGRGECGDRSVFKRVCKAMGIKQMEQFKRSTVSR